MIRSSAFVCLLLPGLTVVAFPASARAQGWAVDLSAGRVVYDPVSINVGSNNAMATLRYDALRGVWVYGTAATPLRDGDPAWGAFGAGGRLESARSGRRRVTIGADLGTHGFLFRDDVALQTGRGGTLEAIPFAGLQVGAARIELRGGWRGQTLALAGVTENRAVFESGARTTYGERVRVQGEVRWVHASEGSYPFAGGSLVYSGAPFELWAQAGRWLSGELDDPAWGAGIGVALGNRATMWASVRQEAPDPLYWNAARRSWSVGVTHRLGRGAPALEPALRNDPEGVLIRVSVDDVPGEALSIAGDFNKWEPVPMRREGRQWVIRLPLTPGVYNYAFRSSGGEWFVPASVAGRRADGMGGHVAVLVVV